MSSTRPAPAVASAQATRGGKRGQGRTRQEQQAPGNQKSQESGQHALRVHTLHANVPIPYLTPNDLTANVRAVGSKFPSLPPPGRLAFYGGLGVLAVAGAVDWPVAVAIGAATVVARGKGKTTQKKDEPAESKEPKDHTKRKQ